MTTDWYGKTFILHHNCAKNRLPFETEEVKVRDLVDNLSIDDYDSICNLFKPNCVASFSLC